jgi:DNA-binding NtrC family response regulator
VPPKIAVLLIDTDLQALAVVRSLFADHRISEAHSISDADRLLVEDEFDIAIIGPGLAHRSGFGEAQVLLKTNPTIPFVCVVDGLLADDLRSALRSGCQNVIEAPLDRFKVDAILSHASKFNRQVDG